MGERIKSAEGDEEILSSVRRVLAQGAARDGARPSTVSGAGAEPPEHESVLRLDPAMMIDGLAPPAAAAADPEDMPILGEDPGRHARRSLHALRDAMAERGAVQAHRGGPTIEEMVREEIRPVLRDWLDRYLPPLVERLVRAEIARIANAERF